MFKSGKWSNVYHLAFLGLRRTGKTFLMKQLLSQVTNIPKVYLDVSKINTTPQEFSKSLVVALFQAIYKKDFITVSEIRLETKKKEIYNKLTTYLKIIEFWETIWVLVRALCLL